MNEIEEFTKAVDEFVKGGKGSGQKGHKTDKGTAKWRITLAEREIGSSKRKIEELKGKEQTTRRKNKIISHEKYIQKQEKEIAAMRAIISPKKPLKNLWAK